MKRNLFIYFIIILVSVFIIFAYKQNNKISNNEQISLRLKWLDQAQFAGYYVAQKKGLYTERGLEVNIVPGGPDISPVQMVVMGVDDFGITGADQIILAREKGIPLVAIAVIYKDSPVVITSLADKNITTPKDLEGKKVAVVYGRDEEIVYRALLKKENVNVEKIIEVPSMASPNEVLGQVDARVDYEFNGGILLPLKGYEINMIKPRNYGLRFYGDTLFTTERMIQYHPKLVKDFVEATIEGWKMAIENPETTTEIVMEINSTLERDHQYNFLKNSIPFIIGKGAIGYSEKEVWEEMQKTLLNQDLLKASVNIESLFTNKFLNNENN